MLTVCKEVLVASIERDNLALIGITVVIEGINFLTIDRRSVAPSNEVTTLNDSSGMLIKQTLLL